MINKNTKNMNESMFSQIDLIRQDSKDVRDFVKNIFKDREFKKMSNDKDFIKYLKSIYEGTHLDEEHVKFSNRTTNGSITTGSVQTTNETIKEDQDCWDTHKVGNPKTKISSKTGKRVNNCVPKGESVVSEASIKGKNNKTGESFGMVIGSDKKNREGDFEVTVRKTYSSRITSYKFIFDNSSNLIEIADYGYSMDGKFPDMKGSASVKSVKPNPRETIIQIAKVTSPAFAKKIYQHVKKVNESVPQGYNPMVEDKSEIKGLVKKVGNKETKFYDVLSAMEKKYGKSKYRIWLEKSLKDFGVNSKHYDYRTNGAAEEKLFQLGKK